MTKAEGILEHKVDSLERSFDKIDAKVEECIKNNHTDVILIRLDNLISTIADMKKKIDKIDSDSKVSDEKLQSDIKSMNDKMQSDMKDINDKIQNNITAINSKIVADIKSSCEKADAKYVKKENIKIAYTVFGVMSGVISTIVAMILKAWK